jgi:tRNA-specific 2-thiouridylase
MRAGLRVGAKIRYRSPASACTLCPLDNERFSIHFDEPQRAITPGQIVAIYDGARLLGGGIIE